MPDWLLPSIVSCFLTLVVTLLVITLRNRRALLTYHDTHNRIGISTRDNIHGEVSVRVGGEQMQNLYMSNIWLVNRSMRDVEDLEIKVFTGVEQMILLSENAYIEGTVDILNHTERFEQIKNQLLNSIAETDKFSAAGEEVKASQIHQAQAANWKLWNKQRWYRVPVLTRGQTVRFTYMTNLPSNDDPAIFISCQKAGVRVKYKLPYQPVLELFGVPLDEAGFAGIVIGALIWLVVISSISNLWFATLLCLITGLLCTIPGAVVVKFYKLLRDQIIG